MSLFTIAWRNMQQRGLASLLTMFSMALGVCLVVLVLSIGWLIQSAFSRNSNVGYNLIVGSKGSPLQLTLNTVFYLSKPIEVLPYDDYLEFLPQEERVAEIKRIGGEIAEPRTSRSLRRADERWLCHSRLLGRLLRTLSCGGHQARIL